MSANLNSIPGIAHMRKKARASLPRAVFDFIDGGADDELTLDANRDAFARYNFTPRVLHDVSRVNVAGGFPAAVTPSMPVIIAPTGLAGVAWPHAETLLAAVAKVHNIPFTLAALGSCSIEDIAAVGHAHKWFQIYVLRDREITLDLVSRAERSGYNTLVITVDVPVIGKRERDVINGFTMPLALTPRSIADFAFHPRWSMATLRTGVPLMQSLTRYNAVDATSVAAHAAWINRLFDPAADWDAINTIRDAWPHQLIIKGVLHPQDAERALAAGADGIVVSNHGGRQLDGAMASIDALENIATTLQGRLPLILDSGVRRGSDVVKALCLGASAVMIGRPALFGVAVGGEAGANRVLTILKEEIARTLALIGVDDINKLEQSMVTRAPG